MSVNVKQLLSPSKFLHIYTERKGREKLKLSPVAVELHWTSACNYDCIHCSYGSRRQAKGRLADAVIQAVVDDLIELETQAVYLSGGGEPTTVKGWDRFAQQLIDNAVEVALITNGMAIREEHIHVLRKMNYIAISVYSVDEKEYRQITGSNFFSRQFLMPSLIKAVDNKAIVGARCVLNSINHEKITQIYKQAISAGFDYIIFVPAVDYENRGICLGEADLKTIKDILQRDYNLFDTSRTNVDLLMKRDIHHYDISDYRESFISLPNHCIVAYLRGNAFINYDGGVYLCQPHIGDEAYSIGNVNVARFKDIWNSPRHLQVIEKLDGEFSQGLCKNCRAINFNKTADAYDNKTIELSDVPRDPFI